MKLKADTFGGNTPVVLVNLKDKEKILAAHDIMLYKEPKIQVHRRTVKSLGVSLTHLMSIRAHGAGSNEEEYYFAEFEGPGNVTFSRDKSGEVRVLDLAEGQTIRLRSGHLICFDETVKYYPMVLTSYTVWRGGEREIEYVLADELSGPGTIVFQSFGNILTFQLSPQEQMRTSIAGLLMTANTVGLQVNWLGGGGGSFSGNWAIPIVDLWGPGQVMVHSGL